MILGEYFNQAPSLRSSRYRRKASIENKALQETAQLCLKPGLISSWNSRLKRGERRRSLPILNLTPHHQKYLLKRRICETQFMGLSKLQ